LKSYRALKELVHLLHLQLVDGFNCNIFQYPVSDGASFNVSEELIKKPDIKITLAASHIRATTEPFDDAWFCECKLIEKSHSSRTLAAYVNQGMNRFLEKGHSYAWAMPHAQMIAYVRGYTPAEMSANKTLIEHLGNPPFMQDSQIVITNHQRAFTLTDGSTPGDITLRHLWFYI
jgi:hypothetical protein